MMAANSLRSIWLPEIVLWMPDFLRGALGLGGMLGRSLSSASPDPVVGTPFTTRGKSLGASG